MSTTVYPESPRIYLRGASGTDAELIGSSGVELLQVQNSNELLVSDPKIYLIMEEILIQLMEINQTLKESR